MIKMQKQILNFNSAIPKALSKDKLSFLTRNSTVICSEFSRNTLIELRQVLGSEKYFVAYSNHSTADGQWQGVGKEMYGEWLDGTVYMPVTNSLPEAIKNYTACNRWIAVKHCEKFFEKKLEELKSRVFSEIKYLAEQLAQYETGGK